MIILFIMGNCKKNDWLHQLYFCDIINMVIKMKRIIALCLCTLIIACLGACGTSADKDTTTYNTTVPSTEIPTTQSTTTPTETVTEPSTEEVTIPYSEPISDTAPITTPPTQPVVTQPVVTEPQTAPPTEETTMGKTGEMAFSDSKDNRYIKAIADKYSVNSANLVAIYTVPQNDANMVLEFSGKTDASGKLIRDSSTLVAIYTIDASLNSKRASKDSSKNEYDYGEMSVMYIAVTTYIMPEFKDYL